MLLGGAACGVRPKAPAPVRFEAGDTVQYVPVDTKVFALTYDDGPNPPYTTEILDLLKAEGVKATFFLVGENVARHPDVAKRIQDEGHDIGNHTFSHPLLEARPRDEVIREIEMTEREITKATGQRAAFFRSSFGTVPRDLGSVCEERGYLVVGWSLDGNDWSSKEPREIADLVMSRLHPGAIVLLHDGRDTHDGHDQSRCVEATRMILREAKAQGYEAVSMRALIGRYRPSPDEIQFPGGCRYMGMRLVPPTVPAGGELRAAYYWYFTADATRETLGIAVHYAGADGVVGVQDDHDLNTGHIKAFEDKVFVPAGLKPGAYTAQIALCRGEEPKWIDRVPLQTELPVKRRMARTHSVLTVTAAAPAPRQRSGQAP